MLVPSGRETVDRVLKLRRAKMKSLSFGALAHLAVALIAVTNLSPAASGREKLVPLARLTVTTGMEGCGVELDSVPAGKTGANGMFVLAEVEPTDHYLHVLCPNRAPSAHFISPRAGEAVEVRPQASETPPPSGSALEAAEAKIRLRNMVREAVQMRVGGRLEEAVGLLRDATKLDPENSDLHRELGITFLLGKEWKRARVEMLEAIRHKSDDADAHNGLGYALEKLGSLEAAIKEYRIATRLEPEDSQYRRHYMDALGKLAVLQAEKKKP